MTSPPPARIFDWRNFAVRAASGTVLGSVAVGAVWAFGQPEPLLHAPFLVLIAIAAALLSIEWARMATPRAANRVAVCLALATVAASLLAFTRHFVLAWAVIPLGAAAAAVVGQGGRRLAADAGFGALYIAPACLVLTWLVGTRQGGGWTLMLFAVTWSADIAAFLVGSLVKGPKLWPRFSPNKTWSGFFGGLAAASLAAVAVAAFLMHLSLAGAALILDRLAVTARTAKPLQIRHNICWLAIESP